MRILDLAVNVSQVPQRSPFRYPGGKTWLIPTLRRWLTGRQTNHPLVFIEPFAGGATGSLLAVMEGYCKTAYLSELDPEVALVQRNALSSSGNGLAGIVGELTISEGAWA